MTNYRIGAQIASKCIADSRCLCRVYQGATLMYFRGLFAACVAAVLCASVVETADAYPITARSGTTTVTGLYRPLDLNLTIVAGSDGFALDGDGYASLTAAMTGDYTATGAGYPVGGPPRAAGNWEIWLSFDEQAATVAGNVITAGVPSYMGLPDLPYFVGSLKFLGGGDYSGLPAGDIPAVGDTFDLFAEALGGVLEVTCEQDASTCGAFSARLLQALTHVGPYVNIGEGSSLDDGTLCQGISGPYPGPCDAGDTLREPRSSLCTDLAPCTIPVAGFGIAGANVPEPASLALVGIGLIAVAIGRRRWRLSSATT
ncbi:MAG: PEP-CTERM sorting domain-containing protein [Rhodoferax sp.]|nr:PEP-CTERM sorting domain-containing protein [Rhodoferax sp.]MCB2006112.1 PEP-CTERM sorting domain-containing protein [Rhodoferax sp.]MCB2028229.1 PEP-CTERM sorting domain-containing protein [Rhodoferax sp.]